MTRSEIITRFRAENPEVSSRVATDVVLNNWCLDADKIICAITRCIVSDETFDSIASSSVYLTRYDLTDRIDKFYDIDKYPGGSISFDNNPLEETTVSELDCLTPSWRTRSAGTPKKYYRRGKWLYFDRPVETAGLEIRVYAVLISDDFDNDTKTPFNELTYLEPFHNGINKYLQWQAKLKVGKPEEATVAEKDFYSFAEFMKKTIGGGKYGKIYFQPK